MTSARVLDHRDFDERRHSRRETMPNPLRLIDGKPVGPTWLSINAR